MKQFAVVAIFIGLLFASAGCGRVPKSGKVEMKNVTDSVSYALGYLEANGWSQRFKSESPFDSLDMKSVASGFANGMLSKRYVDHRSDQFGGFNEEIFVTAFINKLAYDKSYFDENSADVVLRRQFEKARLAKDTIRQAQAQENLEKGTAFLEENKKRAEVITLESGLQYEVLVEGNGPKPQPTDRVKIHYHGTLIDGTVFDSSVERGEPMVHNANGFISGWNEALQLMPVGSKWKLYIPANLAYGVQGAGENIGPNQALVFEVELLGIEEQ
jgi:FKBP-type peptidyl-prolyl cis-trans isomerase FklB